MEPEGNAPSGLIEEDVLGSDRPLAGKRPVVEAQSLRDGVGAPVLWRGARRRVELAAARVAKVGLGRAQLLPVGRRLDACALGGHEVPVDPEQLLEAPLKRLVVSFAEGVVRGATVPG